MEFSNLLFIFCTIIVHTGFRLKIERRVYKWGDIWFIVRISSISPCLDLEYGEKPPKLGFSLAVYLQAGVFFGFFELEVVFWDNINYIFNCINSDFKLKKNLKLKCGLMDINSPLHLFLHFLFLKSASQKKLSYEIMCCSTQCILCLLIIWRNPFKKKCRILKSLFFRSVKPKSKGSEKAKKQEKGDKRFFFQNITHPTKLKFLDIYRFKNSFVFRFVSDLQCHPFLQDMFPILLLIWGK